MIDWTCGFCWHILTMFLISKSHAAEMTWQKNLKQRKARAALHRALKFLREMLRTWDEKLEETSLEIVKNRMNTSAQDG